MPDRYIKSIAGMHGGVLVIAGVWYIAMGVSWFIAPSPDRGRGIGWVPHPWVTQETVGLAWLLAGLFALIVGLMSARHRVLENIAHFTTLFILLLMGLWFAAAWLIGESERGLIATIVYLGPAAIIGWVGARGRDQVVVVDPAEER